MKLAAKILLGAIAVLALSATAHARTPAQTKALLADLLPAGSHARFVWVQKEPVSYASLTGLLYVLDSDSGIMRPVSLTAQHNAYDPHLTADGTRIVFWDWNRGETRVIGWNGQGLATVTSRYMNDCWRNPSDNTDWAIVTDNSNGGNVYRVNLSTKTEVALSNNKFSCAIPVSISQDGTHVGAFMGSGGGWVAGVGDVNTGTLTLEQNSSGCIANIFPDNSYSWTHQISGHKEIKISTSPTVFTQINIVDSILKYAAKNNGTASCVNMDAQFEQTRFTNLPNYITYYMDNIKGNPYIQRLSDKKWVSINDTLGCSIGSTMNAVILGVTGVADGRSSLVRVNAMTSTNSVTRNYGIDGRLLRGSVSPASGVKIRTSGDRAVGTILLK